MSVAKRQATELKALQAQDLNDDKTLAGMLHKKEMKEEGCKFADKSSKDVVAVAEADSINGKSTVTPTRGNVTRQ
jgi:hypothetical protein